MRKQKAIGVSRCIHQSLVAAVLIGSAVTSHAVADESDVVRVATRQVPPFAMRDQEGVWHGISIRLVEELRDELQTERGREVTLDYREMSLEEMVMAVESGEVDLAAAALTVNFEREKRVDFSHSYFSSGLGIAVSGAGRREGLFSLVQSVLSPTFLRIVAGLVATMLAIAVAIYFFERRINRDQFGGGAIRGIASGLWWSAVTLTTVGYGDKVPKSAPGRLIGLVWMFSGLFIIASFTAAVTSALTVTQLRSQITGPSDLARCRVATVQDSTSHAYLRSRRIHARRHPDISAALLSLKEGECDAVVYDAPVMRFEVHRHFADELFVLPVAFERQEYAFAFATGSPLRESVNRALLRATSGEAWEATLAELLGERIND